METGQQNGRTWSAAQADAPDVDGLISELCVRTGVPAEAARRVSALLSAVLAVTADLELSEVLSRIVRSACDLVDAQYGALGVLGHGGGQLGEFVTHGISDEEWAAIGQEPHGRGVVGLLMRDPRPLRIADLPSHPESCGVPPNHPPMRTFIGVPVRVHETVFGNLYLAEKRSGEAFSEEDERILVALAVAAGLAIEHARAYDHSRRQRACAQLVGEMTRQLLNGIPEARATGSLLAQACGHTRAAAGLIALYDEDGELEVVADHPGGGRGQRLHSAGWSELIRSGTACWSDSTTASRLAAEACALLTGSPGEAVILAPLQTAADDLGVLALGWGAGVDADEADLLGLVTELANQTATALSASRARLDRTRLGLLEERDRIARDMHDHVIQRVFATGLSLQAASLLAVHPVVRQRLEEAVDELDEAIKDIRRTIFELRGVSGPHGLSQALQMLVATAEEALGFRPTLQLIGQVDEVAAEVASDLLAVTRESLANIARHADAGSARLTVRRTADRLEVNVVDDGNGIDPDVLRRSGLQNLQDRAAARGGELRTVPASGGGTRLVWWVPL